MRPCPHRPCVRDHPADVCGPTMCQGVGGRVLFGEELALQWWCGAGLILTGVALVAGCEVKEAQPAERAKGD
jgi:hypothetical protein